MDDTEYVLATNFVKLEMAENIVHEVIAGKAYGISPDTRKEIINSLRSASMAIKSMAE